jgi:electron transfer flavoprotein beta subunit
MDVLVCVKRVPMVGGTMVVTQDGQDIENRTSGFTVSPHEVCAVEEAIQLTHRTGGSVTVLTLGPPEAADQLRDMLALGANHAVLLETDGREWGPVATADAIAEAARGDGSGGYDLLLFGNEAADTGDCQVPVRVAHALALPCATGIKHLEAGAGVGLRGRREHRGVQETFDLPLPAVVSVKEGINVPRYPSQLGRLRAKRAAIERRQVSWHADRLRKQRLRLPQRKEHAARVLGTGTEAVPALVALLDEMGVLP